MRRRILVPSAGGPGTINLTRSLKMMEPAPFTVGTDVSEHYLLLAETDKRLLAPRRTDTTAYIGVMNDLVKQFDIDFIFPNNSLDGVVLSGHREELAAPIFLPAVPVFEVGESKWRTFRLLRDAGLPVPRTWLLDEPKSVEEAFSACGSGPVWVRGAGIPGKGVGVASLPARTVAQAVQWVEYWAGWGGMCASEFLPGENLTWLGVWNHGRLVASQGRQRDAYVIPHVSPSGITGAPAISHTVVRKDINELGRRTCLAIDPLFHGPAFVDFKVDESGLPKITEINVGRFGTTHHFYTMAGANFPSLVLSLALGDPLPGWVKPFDVLPGGFYWIRTLDAGPVLTNERELAGVLATGGIPD